MRCVHVLHGRLLVRYIWVNPLCTSLGQSNFKVCFDKGEFPYIACHTPAELQVPIDAIDDDGQDIDEQHI